jgi:hypothetical protein
VHGDGSLTGLVAVYSPTLNVSWGLGGGNSQWSPWFYVDDPGEREGNGMKDGKGSSSKERKKEGKRERGKETEPLFF